MYLFSNFFQNAAQMDVLPVSLRATFNDTAQYLYQHERKIFLYSEFEKEKSAGTFDQLTACKEIANSVHGTKRRRNGKKVIDSHILSVVNAPDLYVDITYTPEQVMLAWVHDVPEDSKGAWKVRHFDKLGFSKTFCTGLDGMTHREGEKYFDYIERLSKTIALEVKIGDNRHNWSDDPKPVRAMLYRISSHYLLAVKYGKIEAGSSIAEWAVREGMYDPDLFSKYSSRPRIEKFAAPSDEYHMAGILAPAAI